jgi:putative transposase
LKKLDVRRICRSTVINILKEHGLDPGPQRGEDSWDAFLKRHAATLWACDFFSKKVWTTAGLVEFHILFFINVGTRRVYVSGMSAQPDRAWMVQQARNVAMHFAEPAEKPALLLCDHDTKFVKQFDELLEAEGVAVKRVGPLAPNLNAYAERWVQSIGMECLHRFVVFGEAHLRHLVGEYVGHYNEERAHQAKDNLPLTGLPPPPVSPLLLEEVNCRDRLGGLLEHYYRRVARSSSHHQPAVRVAFAARAMVTSRCRANGRRSVSTAVGRFQDNRRCPITQSHPVISLLFQALPKPTWRCRRHATGGSR